MRISDWISRQMFNVVHRRNLVYNTCWEDPRLDRQALKIGPDDTIAMLTSAGCNALDYALLAPKEIHCIDVNPKQNALLELKKAGIRHLDFDTFYSMFGKGGLGNYQEVYRDVLRRNLPSGVRHYWDRKIEMFSGQGRRQTFYYHGTAGLLAWLVRIYIDKIRKRRDAIEQILDTRTLEEQQALYYEKLEPGFWSGFMRWAMRRDATLSFLGVPRQQRHQIDRCYPGGISKFIQDRIEAVFTRIPLSDNYFWRVYLNGQYEPDCCPEYLKEANFNKLKADGLERIQTHNCTVLDFLSRHPGEISRFVLLDHMDWLSAAHADVLKQQWQAIIDRASRNTRLIWRSGALEVDYVDPIKVRWFGTERPLGEVLQYDRELADVLHPQDRVHTYGSFYIADLIKA